MLEKNTADLDRIKKNIFNGIRYFVFFGFPIAFILLQVLYVRTVAEHRAYLWIQGMGAALWLAMMTLYDQAKEITDLKNKMHHHDSKINLFRQRDFTI